MSNKDEHGGSAFPYAAEWGYEAGMSLRDWFAGQAAASIVGGLSAARCTTDAEDALPLARAAYLLADAMLEARK